MFAGALSFNQDIGNWNVSGGTDFVSIVMNTKVAMYESNHLTHVITLPYLFIFMYRLPCLKERLYLIKTLAIGMSPVVQTLYVLL